jgi:hypothetical protein
VTGWLRQEQATSSVAHHDFPLAQMPCDERHCVRQGPAVAHDRTIITASPGEMWVTEGAKVFTLEDGWADLRRGGALKCRVRRLARAKHGDRYTALEPLAQGVTQYYGGVEADVVRGLAVRLDHGTQYPPNLSAIIALEGGVVVHRYGIVSCRISLVNSRPPMPKCGGSTCHDSGAEIRLDQLR